MNLVRLTRGFLEFFVIGNPLKCPDVLPLRYQTRSSLVDKDTYLAKSAVFDEPPIQSKESSVHGGIWIVPADLQPRGEFSDDKTTIRGLSCVFGIGAIVSKEDLELLTSRIKTVIETHFTASLQSLQILPQPSLVLYHGSSREAWETIIKEGLVESSGMLGRGVYLGSFYKACRFASRDQKYEWRGNGGIIIRCYVFADNVRTLDHLLRPSYTCSCSSCQYFYKNLKRSASRDERMAHTDHESRWALDSNCSGIHLPARRCKTDPSLWIVRNEEWCLRPSSISVQSAALLDFDSIPEGNYDPLQRNQQIA